MKPLNEGLFKKKTADEKAEYLKYKELKKKFSPLRKRVGRKLAIGAILGTILFFNSIMGWQHVSPELYNKYQQYNNECNIRYEQMAPEEKASFNQELARLQEKYNITSDVDISKMSHKEFVNYVDKKKNLMDSEDRKSLWTKGLQVLSSTGKNASNVFWKILNRFGFQNPFEGSQIKVRSPFYMKESKNMTFREYLTEAEEAKKRFAIKKIINYARRTLVALFIAAGLTLTMANAKADDAIKNNLITPTPQVYGMTPQNVMDLDGVVNDAFDTLKDTGITTYDKATELGKEAIKKSMDIGNKVKNKIADKVDELSTEEGREKLKSKIPSKKQLKNILQKGADAAVKGFEQAKEKAKDFMSE